MEVKEITELVDWELMAVPQSDGSDTSLFLKYAKDTNLNVIADPRPEEPKIFNNRVALRHLEWDKKFLEEFEHAPFGHSSIKEAEALIAFWPEVYNQCGALLKAINPVLKKGIPDDKNYTGSNSHQPKNTLGAVWATVHNPVLLAQALVHEMAHNKLFSIGQHFESKYPLFANDKEEVFDSPIRLDIPRPMSAVFHGVYAFTHVLTLDRILYQKSDIDNKGQLLGLLHYNALRVKKGAELIRKCAKLTDIGDAFVNKFLTWAEEEVESALNIWKQQVPLKETPILIIGPDHAEKFEFAEQLGTKKGRQVINASEICWDIWATSAVVTKRQAEVYGSDQVAKIFRNSKKFSNKEFLQNWIRNKVLHPQEIEFMKLQLCHYLITEFPKSIICLGEDHAWLQQRDFVNRLQCFFQETATKVVYARPLLPIHEAVDMLDSSKTEDRKSKLHDLLHQSSYRTLSSYTFDTNKYSDELLSELI